MSSDSGRLYPEDALLWQPVELLVPVGRVTEQPDGDVTFYLSDDEFAKSRRRSRRWSYLAAEGKGTDSPSSYEAYALVRFVDADGQLLTQPAPFTSRLAICRSDDGLLWSVTCRLDTPRTCYAYDADVVARTVWQCIKERAKERQRRGGLLILAGGTNTGKSTIAKVICEELLGAADNGLVAHVVSAEDPIETWKWFGGEEARPADESRLAAARSGHRTWKTMRHRHRDMASLRTALMGTALRQTPALVIVGEVREDSDWQTVVEFARTGHWCVVTTHAGSLTQAVMRVMRAVNAKTAADRQYLVDTLLAVLHITAAPVPGRERLIAQLPALWVPSRRSARSFTNNGLAALLPESWTDEPEHGPSGFFSRRYFLATMFPKLLVNQFGGQARLAGVPECRLSGHFALSLLLRPRDGGPGLEAPTEFVKLAHAAALCALLIGIGISWDDVAKADLPWSLDTEGEFHSAWRLTEKQRTSEKRHPGPAAQMAGDVMRAELAAAQTASGKVDDDARAAIKMLLGVIGSFKPLADNPSTSLQTALLNAIKQEHGARRLGRYVQQILSEAIAQEMSQRGIDVDAQATRVAWYDDKADALVGGHGPGSASAPVALVGCTNALDVAIACYRRGMHEARARREADRLLGRLAAAVPSSYVKTLIGPKSAALMGCAVAMFAAAVRPVADLAAVAASAGASPDRCEHGNAHLVELIVEAWQHELPTPEAPAYRAPWLALPERCRRAQRCAADSIAGAVGVGQHGEAGATATTILTGLLDLADALDLREL